MSFKFKKKPTRDQILTARRLRALNEQIKKTGMTKELFEEMKKLTKKIPKG